MNVFDYKITELTILVLGIIAVMIIFAIPKNRYDVNGDGKVNEQDIKAIEEYICKE